MNVKPKRKRRKTVYVRDKEFKISEYCIRVQCPYCKIEMNFHRVEKFIDTYYTCKMCNNEFRVWSIEE